MGDEITKEQWKGAKTHFDAVWNEYIDLQGTPGVNVGFAIAITFIPLSRRFEQGERTKQLYDEMLAVE